MDGNALIDVFQEEEDYKQYKTVEADANVNGFAGIWS